MSTPDYTDLSIYPLAVNCSQFSYLNISKLSSSLNLFTDSWRYSGVMENSFSSVVSATSDNLTRLTQTLQGDVVANGHYKRAMAEITPLFHPRFFSSQAVASPREMVRQSFLGSARAIVKVPDELLTHIPPPKATFSLFQGFEARSAPDTLGSCAIRKELAATEIREIDEQIAKFKNMRKVVFDQVAAIEKDERRIAKEEVQKEQLKDEEQNEVAPLSRKEKRKPSSRRRSSITPTLQAFYAPGDRIRSLKTGEDAVAALDIDTPFGTLAAAVGPDVQVWDLSSGELRGTLNQTASVRAMQIHDSHVLSGGADAAIHLWSLDSLEQVSTLKAHLEPVTCLHWRGSTVVSGSDDKTLRQWDIETSKCVQTLDVLSAARPQATASAAIAAVAPLAAALGWAGQPPAVGAVQHFGAALAAGTADGIVRLWDLRAGQVVRSLPGHSAPVTALHFDEAQLASGSLDRSVRVWDLRTGGVVDTWAYDQPVLDLCMDQKKVVCAIGDSVAHIYERSTGVHWSVGPGDAEPDPSPITSVSQQKGYLVEGRLDGTVGVWAC